MTRTLFILALLLMPSQALGTPGVLTDALEPYAPDGGNQEMASAIVYFDRLEYIPATPASISDPRIEFRPVHGFEKRTYIKYVVPQAPGADWILERAELVIKSFIFEVERFDPETGERLFDTPDVLRVGGERVVVRLLTDAILPEPIGAPVPGATGLSTASSTLVYDVTPLLNHTPLTDPTPVVLELRAPQAVRDSGQDWTTFFTAEAYSQPNPRLYLWWSSPAVKAVESASFGEIKALYGSDR